MTTSRMPGLTRLQQRAKTRNEVRDRECPESDWLDTDTLIFLAKVGVAMYLGAAVLVVLVVWLVIAAPR